MLIAYIQAILHLKKQFFLRGLFDKGVKQHFKKVFRTWRLF
jgi:hypothetical protein